MSKSIKSNHLINEKNYLLHIPLLFLAIYSVSPLLILFLNSFKSNTEVMGYPLNFPVIFRFQNYIDVWGTGNYWQAYKNSVTVGLITTITICIISGFTAYSLSFFKSSKMGLIAIYFLSATAIPAQIYIVPLYA
ncbi:MAG TPA: carbohydrate ABC transporter permease, partial [Candidatus Atribacteria bacterium]|nr:carbohydrate ABC transporter permease [Candidatus Atribacteria bacterium]